MEERVRPVISMPTVYLVLENIWDRMQENKLKFPMWPSSAEELADELQSRSGSLPVLVRTVKRGRYEGNRNILFCTSTYYLQADTSRDGDGYLVIDMRPLGFREHDDLARGAPRLQVGKWVVLNERVQLNYCNPRPGEKSNRYQEILSTWESIKDERLREIAPEQVEEFLTPARERYLNKIEKLVQVSYEAELERGKSQQAILYSKVDPVGKKRYTKHDIYAFHLVPGSAPATKGMFLCLEDDPGTRGRVTKVEEDHFELRFEKAVDINQVRSAHALIQVAIHAAYKVQRDAIASLREKQAANPYLLEILADNRYHPYILPGAGLAAPIADLNKRQKQAFQEAQAVRDMLLVLGPPGTGKTLTIQEIIRACSRHRERVLLTAKTHKAVDNVLQQLPTDQLWVLRVGQEDKVGLRDLLLDEQARKLQQRTLEETTPYSEELQKIYEHLEEYDMRVERCLDFVKALDRAENRLQEALTVRDREGERIRSDYEREKLRIKAEYEKEQRRIDEEREHLEAWINEAYQRQELAISQRYEQEAAQIGERYKQEKLEINAYYGREQQGINEGYERQKLRINAQYAQGQMNNTSYARETQARKEAWEEASRLLQEWEWKHIQAQKLFDRANRLRNWLLIGFFWRDRLPLRAKDLGDAWAHVQKYQKEQYETHLAYKRAFEEHRLAYQTAEQEYQQAHQTAEQEYQQSSQRVHDEHRRAYLPVHSEHRRASMQVQEERQQASLNMQEERQQASQSAREQRQQAFVKVQEERQQASQRADELYQQAFQSKNYLAIQQIVSEKEQVLSRLTENIYQEALELESILLGHPGENMQRPVRDAKQLKAYLNQFHRDWNESMRQRVRHRHQIMQAWRQELQTRQEDLYPLLLRMADVIGATCIGSATARILADVEFDVVIVDEAGQISIPDLLVPLVRGKRALLFGDHQQLPPLVDENIKSRLRLLANTRAVEADEGKEGELDEEPDQTEAAQETPLIDMLKKSVFELLIEQEIDKDHYVAFKEQHRMPASIAEFASQHFYNKELDTAGRHKKGSHYRDPLFKKPFVFVDTARMEAKLRDERGTRATQGDTGELGSNKSYTNEGEATLITDLVEVYAREQIDWVVIVPYRGQAQLIRERIAARLGQVIELDLNNYVSTVDTFQGGERNVVIYGFTRSNAKRKIGFLSEQRRLNVALTRAKEQLVLVGNSEMLTQAKDEQFRVLAQAMLKHAIDNGECVSFRECRSRITHHSGNGGTV